ncbi:hypothetical protein BH23BAC2_BH23BAC2_12420 [soil metagenome]
MKKGFFTIILIFLISCNADEAREPLFPEEELSSDLFFSEYVEGSGFNKALEIVNLTGSRIDLQAEGYSIKKQTNGAGDWGGELLLTGSLANNEVYVIANEAATHPDILSKASLLKRGAPMDFNGNDPIGLFKDGVLIDIIGYLDNPEDFAKDVTLRRKALATEPSTTYDPNEWELYDIDNVEGLGSY